MLKNKRIVALMLSVIIVLTTFSTTVVAITEVDNGIMKVYLTEGGIELGNVDLMGFDVKGYIEDSSSQSGKTLISSTFSDDGYHTFLNVNGTHGKMAGELTYTDIDALEAQIQAMQYTAYSSTNEWQNIDGIKLKVNTQFINNGEQLQIIYTLKNETTSVATYSLATTSDVQIDGDDSATIERIEQRGTDIRLWTKEGDTKKPVQFVFYGSGVEGSTAVDNLWIGHWGDEYMINMFNTNPDKDIIENRDSAFAYSWVNRTINAGETKVHKVLMEVGEINIPNTSITIEDNTKFYYKDVKINGIVLDKDLKDNITIHYVVDGGAEKTLPVIATTGTNKGFTIDLTSLNLSAGTDHTIKVWATDSTDCDSNVVEGKFTVTYLKNPELSVSETEWTKNNVTLKITDTVNEAQYVDKYQYRINNGNWVDCQKDTDISIQENGITQIDARIIGTQNNDYSNIVTKSAKIDRVNPTDTIPTATKTTCSITVTAAQTDEHSGLDASKTMYAIKKGDTWSEWQASNTFTGLTHNTEYIVKTKSEDKVGNIGESKELKVKTEELLLGKLVLKLNSNEGENYTENTWTNKGIYVSVQEQTAGATTTYKSKEGSAQTIAATNQETIVTSDGTTKLILTVTDGTNTITSDVEHILKVDKIAPVINELSLNNNEWTSTDKGITGKAIDVLSGIVAYQFSSNDNITSTSEGWNTVENTVSEITKTAQISQDGKIYFYVKDAAGNIGTVNIDTKIDKIGPIITFERENKETIVNVTDTGTGVRNTQYAWTTENIEPSETDWEDYTGHVSYDGTSKGTVYLWVKTVDNIGNETISSTKFNAIKKPVIETEDKFTNEYAKFKVNSDNEDNDIIYEFKINNGEWQTITKDMTYTISNIKEGEVIISARAVDNAGRISEITTKTVKVILAETTDNGETNTIKDNTTAPGKIPYTGGTLAIIIGIIGIICMGIYAYKRNNDLKGI